MTFSFNSLHIRRLSAFKHITIVSVVACIVYEKLLINIFHTIAPHLFPSEINILYLTVEEFFFNLAGMYLHLPCPGLRTAPNFFSARQTKHAQEKKPRWRREEWDKTLASKVLRVPLLILTMELHLSDMWWSPFKIDTVKLHYRNCAGQNHRYHV